jgi:hypothetical protein
MLADEMSAGGSGPMESAARSEGRALVTQLAARTGIRIQEAEIDQVAAILEEYLEHIAALDAVALELEAGAPPGLDLLRWLGAVPRDVPERAG